MEDGAPVKAFGLRGWDAKTGQVVVHVDAFGKDRCGRTLGIFRLGKRSVNLELIQGGWAWWYWRYARKNKELAAAEAAARKAKRGLWADPKPIPPWDWRRTERDRRLKARAGADTGYWLNTSTGVRHNRSCPNHHNTKRGRACMADEGNAVWDLWGGVGIPDRSEVLSPAAGLMC